MVFSSALFFFYFLPAALLVYYLIPRRLQHLALTLFSYLFYGWANPYFVLLLFGSTLVDYACGLTLCGQKPWSKTAQVPILQIGGPRTRNQKIALLVSITTNLSLLGFFKYFNFGLDSFNALVSAMGADTMQWHTFFRVTLPLGISFYTFQSMSYTIDVYRGEARAIRNFTDFACYVSMFPQLVAGPIVRFHELADQLQTRDHTVEKFARGVAFISLGLAKKVLLANPCGKIADTCFDAIDVTTLDAWYGAFAYAFQIYFDFSAYSDMAIGLGLLLGIDFPKNFDAPYLSQSITEFWQRWHLSLSHWLRDYLYIPLGGNRKGEHRTYVNLATVMVLGGLWHGASWNFVIWGGIHGAMLGFERMQGKDSPYRRLPRPLRIATTFVIVTIAWVFFRARDLEAATHYLGNMFGFLHPGDVAALVGGLIYQPYFLICFTLAVAITWMAPQTWDLTRRMSAPKVAWCLAMLWFSLAVMMTQS